MNRHTIRYANWLNASEEEKYAEWSEAVLNLGIGLDYVSWVTLHEAELKVAAGFEEELNGTRQPA